MGARFMLRIINDDSEIEFRWSNSCLCLINVARRIGRFNHLEVIDTINNMVIWQSHRSQ